MKILLFLLLFLPINFKAQNSAAQSTPPVVVELFTSENCPACPPADVYLGALAERPNIIALSCHVDYFGKTKGKFGRKFCTDQQTRYIKQIGRQSHFTPQMMINGHISEIGYDNQAVEKAIDRAKQDFIKPIEITSQQNGVYSYTLPQTKADNTKLWMATYNKQQVVMKRGKGQFYQNVIERVVPMGDWNGGAVQRPVFPILNNKSAGFAIIAQNESNGRIIAAGDYRF